MLARLKIFWVEVRDSLWFVPGVMTLVGGALAVLVIRLETDGVVTFEDELHWLLGGGPEGARGVLTAIAGSLITVTGVVFSVTIVALQLASSQFTPRVLRNFTADRSNQAVLGVFIGTFTYTVLVLRVVRDGTDTQDPFIPRIGVAVAVILVLVSIGCLIFFIDHAARSMQISVILQRVTRETKQRIERLFPETIGGPDDAIMPEEMLEIVDGATITADTGGYLQVVDGSSLFELGESRDLVIHMEPEIGEYVLPGRPLASIAPAGALDAEVVNQVRKAFALGSERTPDADVEFGIVEIADIAVKALSPSVNDPTTAIHCIDHLGEILLALGNRNPPQDARTREGRIHFVARHLSYERAVGMAFDQIRHYGRDNPAIVKKLLDVLTQLLELVPPARREPLLAQRAAVIADADAIESDVARADVERVVRKVQ